MVASPSAGLISAVCLSRPPPRGVKWLQGLDSNQRPPSDGVLYTNCMELQLIGVWSAVFQTPGVLYPILFVRTLYEQH